MSSDLQLYTPILLIGYNRPESIKKVINSLKRVRPERVYIFCDGPKINNIDNQRKVEMVREVCKKNIDWNCKIKTNFKDQNMGCRAGVKHAIDWFFSQEEAGIILEDDIVPIESFFWFCQEMLEHYKYDTRIAQICGLSREADTYPLKASYSFTRFPHIWGWATWSRSWKLYDDNMTNWSEIKNRKILKQLGDKNYYSYWTNHFDLMSDNIIDTWDYIWAYSVFTQNMISVVPKYNLISNIGFNQDATHTSNFEGKLPKPIELEFPIVHPVDFLIDDTVTNDIAYQTMNSPQYKTKLIYRLTNKIKRLIKSS